MKLLFALVSLLTLVSIKTLCYAQSANFSVSVQVGTTNLILEGYTSPNSFVTFVENSANVATTTADSTGYFTTTLTSYNVTARTLTITSTDTQNRTSSGTSVSVTLIPGTDTTLSNIILSPTFSVNKTSMYTVNDSIIVSGKAVPSSQIQFFIDTLYNTTISVSASGEFTAQLQPSALTIGSHSFYLTSSLGAYESVASPVQSFTIVEQVVSDDDNNYGDDNDDDDDDEDSNDSPASHTQPQLATGLTPQQQVVYPTLPQYPLVPQLFEYAKNIFLTESITNDNIAEYVELWVKYKNRGTLQCDLNQDNICDLVDFSILMYRVGR